MDVTAGICYDFISLRKSASVYFHTAVESTCFLGHWCMERCCTPEGRDTHGRDELVSGENEPLLSGRVNVEPSPNPPMSNGLA